MQLKLEFVPMPTKKIKCEDGFAVPTFNNALNLIMDEAYAKSAIRNVGYIAE